MARAPRPPRPAAAPAPPAGDERVVELTRRLAGVLAELGLSEVEIESADVRVRVQRHVAAVAAVAGPAAAAPAATPAEHPLVADVVSPALVTLEAPMVGTFYRAPSPTAEPFVNEGDVVKENQVLCIIEAMKLMNEIESKVGGRIAKILVENGQAVEYGQPLFLIDPQR
ncbi:MAG TPA: acetyl-CoA carboxylase biotin carboxyl carrier protein [Candidatus Binatia bacterium]|nr:acetyl-CoA carboxylase biotin carboxyl carrier protein [Candidatus Binatia bacterium]